MHKMFISKYKYLLVLLPVFVLWTTLSLTVSVPKKRSFDSSYDHKSIECYRYHEDRLPDISLRNVRKGKSIFFHETSCNSYINGKIVINSRQACAVESAALLNPNLDVYLLYTSPGVYVSEATESDRIFQALLSYNNIRIQHLNYEKYTKGTPVEKLYSEGAIEASHYAVSHSSDVLRYLTLWKYGGIYLDLDVVVLKNLETLPLNFAGCESTDEVASSVIGFAPDGTGNGHILANECVMDLKEKFDGNVWINNGPGVITRLVSNHCNVSKLGEAFDRTCGNLKVFPPETFNPIPWASWKKYFEAEYLEEVINLTRNSYVVHVWNKLSESTKLRLDSKSAYATFARKYCPKVFRQCDKYF